MEIAVVQIALLGLLLGSVTALPNKDDWDIYNFHINSTVTSRYATTVITSRVANRKNESTEIEFQVRIPKNAFISKFRMFIDGQVYDGVVKTKEQAQQQYTQAVSRGESAGIVSSVGRTLEEFKTSVNVAGHKKVTFELTYEELLQRRHGKYELQIHARPMQPVKDFKIDVYIHEKVGLRFIEIKGGLSTNAMANAITKAHSEKQAWVYFYPTVDQQTNCDNCGAQGMNGDLVIVYDVKRDTSLGDLKISDGYFVHHFAPSDLPRIPKNVVFLIDQSGSMHGRKIQQTKSALIHILNDLAEDDFFGLISFDGNIYHWKRELLQASKSNLKSAKEFANNIRDRGSTNINEAVLAGAEMLKTHPREGSASILILLTDGDPTSGETNLEKIQSNVREAIANKFPLYCLGFGFDVNFEFLKTMSLQNSGVARRIYEDSDADLQLKGFYEEVATPLLIDVTMTYMGGTNLTQTNFSQYYNGSEIVVAGQITDNDIETFIPQVLALSGTRRVTFPDTNDTMETTGTLSDSRIQRVWAYLTVKQLLEKELQLSESEKAKVRQEALELSLKYSFVTPLTSMVVTKPPGENTDVLYKPKEGQGQGQMRLTTQSRVSGTRLFARMGVANYPPLRSRHLNLRPTILADRVSRPRKIKGAKKNSRIAGDYFDSVIPQSIENSESTESLTIEVLHTHRFLIKTDNQSLPLCFDVTGNVILQLLSHPNRDLIVNGELDVEKNGGFAKIVIHINTNQSVEVNTQKLLVKNGQILTHHTGDDYHIIFENVTLIRRNKEIDVSAGDVRIVILVHQKNGKEFLWPVLRQRSSDNSFEGILVLKPATYEEVQQTPSTKLKIKDQDIAVTRSTVVDYSIAFSPTLACWLIPADHALPRPLKLYVRDHL